MTFLADISAGKAILIGVASGAVVILAGVATLIAIRRPRRRGPELDIPSAMQPGPPDPDLEDPVRVKLYGWGLVLIAFMAIWVPAVWIREADTNADDLRELQAVSVERGRLTTMPGSEENQLGFNCERCHGQGLTGGQNVFNGAVVPVPDLTTVCGGATTGHPLITSVTDIVNTIAQGRANTDMPSWSVRYAGAMDDQQIADVLNYLIEINREKVPEAQNLCTNPQAAASPSGAASGSPSASPATTPPTPSPPASPSPTP